MNYRIFPPEEILETTVARLPLSKSVAARAMVLASLTASPTAIDPDRIPDCDDIRVLAAALALRTGTADMGASAAAARFMTAFYAATAGTDITVDGCERLRRRPIGPLVDALRRLGADIEYRGADGFLPVAIRGRRLSGSEVDLDASASSQFASALAMIAPTMEKPLRIALGGEIASMPYLKMTMDMLRARGVETDREGYTVTVANTPLRPVEAEAEADWSAAAFWYQIAAVTAGWVTLPGLRSDSLQGDRLLAEIGERFGVVTEFTDEGAELSATPDLFSRLDMDLRDNPDLVPVIAVVGCMINTPYRITGVANLRIKESDRLAALAEELRKCGWVLEIEPDAIGWEGATTPVFEMPRLSPHGDHRLAMALAPIAVWAPGIVITDCEVVGKSYPGYWDDLRDAGFRLEEVE